ncbi:MAG: HEAT repeat domain-containing protein [Acidimicrobiales bacterium]
MSARRLVVERDLVRAAFEHLTFDAFMTLPFEALGPTKALLRRFFSDEPWTAADDDALAAAVGAGEGRWQRDLDDDLVLEYGWADGRFIIRVAMFPDAPSGPSNLSPDAHSDQAGSPDGFDGPGRASEYLAGTFDGPVVPEATPNPRTIRFQVGPIHDGPSRWFESPASAGNDDPGVARLFGQFDEVTNVLVGTDFVAVGLRRPGDWERLLRPVLAVVTEEFAPAGAGAASVSGTGPARVTGGPAGAGSGPPTGRPSGGHLTRLEQAWRDLGALRPADAADLALVRAAATGDDPSHRQVAANLLREADAAVAAGLWAAMVTDPVWSVRRAAVDAMVDVDRQELRPMLEAALADRDAWVRWKALRGLARLGPDPSRAAITAHADDPDFHVRLEAAAALRAPGPA